MSKEQDIIDNLITDLNTIDSIKSVNDGMVYPKSEPYEKFPYLNIVELSETKYSQQNATGTKYMSGENARDTTDAWPVTIFGYVRTQTAEKVQPELRTLKESIISKVLADQFRGDNAVKTTLAWSIKNPNLYERNNIGVVAVTFNIKYKFEV